MNLGIKTADRQTAIDFLIARGAILKYEPEERTLIPDKWITKAVPAVHDKEPSADDLAKLVEIIKVDEHEEVTKPEVIVFDAAVQDTDGLLKSSSPIVRTLTPAVVDKNGNVTTPAVLDTFICRIRFKDDEAGIAMATALDEGGTISSKFKLAARAEMTAEAAAKGETLARKEAKSRAIPAHTATLTKFDAEGAIIEETVDVGPVTVFQIGGESGIPPDELGRKYLGE